ncbi:MAG: CAP domain-containing protein, partial [Chloroflexota bacterium]
CFSLIAFILPNNVTAQDNLPPTAEAMSAALNQWRLDEGLAPLHYNPTLEALARVQIEYLLTLPNIPKNLHDGMLSEGVRERALWEPYAWPYYGIPERVSMEEITVAQKTIAQGIDWWRNSPIHNAAATNPNYREFGVASLPYEYGTVFVAVLAGRPNVIPAMVHPDDDMLYLTRETYSGVFPEHLSGINEFRLLDIDENPLTDWEEWTPTRTLAGIDATEFYVEYGNGESTLLTHIDRSVDIVRLPSGVDRTPVGQVNENAAETLDTVPVTVEILTDEVFALRIESNEPVYVNDFSFVSLKLDAFSPSAAFTDFAGIPYAGPGACFIFAAQGTVIDELESCTGPVSLIRVPPDRMFWYDNVRETLAGFIVLDHKGARLADCRDTTQSCTFEVTSYPFVAGQGPSRPVSEQIRLIYNRNTFTLINEGGQLLDVADLEFTDGETTFLAFYWETDVISELSAGHCLQLAAFGNLGLRKPLACGVRQRWVSVREGEQFWMSGTFEVQMDGATIAECRTDEDECVFELP